MFISILFYLSLFFILAEVFLRIATHTNILKPSIFKKSTQAISYILKPNFKGWFAGALVTTNSYGLRNKECSLEKKPSIYRIFCLGDSITFGYGVDDTSTFPFQLEIPLNRKSKKYEVINGGVTGYNTAQERILLERIGMKFHPDFIIIGFSSNDITGGLRIPTMSGALMNIADDPYRLDDMDFFTRIEYALARNSYFYQFMLLKFQALLKKCVWYYKDLDIEGYPKRVIDYFGGRPNKEIKRREKIFMQELLSIKNLADKNKAKALLLFFPSRIHLEKPNLSNVQNTLNDFCKKIGIYYLNLISLLSNFKKEEIFIDSDHLSGQGYKFVALEVYNVIKNLVESRVN